MTGRKGMDYHVREFEHRYTLWPVNMLKAIPKSWLSWDYSIVDGSKQVADIDLAFFREKGKLTVEGEEYTVYRENLASGDFILDSGNGVLARAEKPSALFRRFTIDHQGRQYTLEAASALSRRFVLLDGSTEIGSITPAGLLTRKASVDLPKDLPLPIRIFIAWLTLIMWRRDSESS